MPQENVESLRAFLETWGQRPWTLEDWQRGEVFDMSFLDPDVAYEDTVLPDHGDEVYRGHEGIVRAGERWIEGFEWRLVELEQIVVAGERLVSLHRARSKALHTGIEFEAPVAYLWTFRDGKVIHFRSYRDIDQAIEAAGPGDLVGADGGPAGGGWPTLGSIVLDRAAARLKLRTADGQKLKLMLMSGSGVLGSLGGGESQSAGVEALGHWLADADDAAGS